MFVGLLVSVEVAQGAVDAVALARPRAYFDCFHVSNVYASHEGRALTLAPLLIDIDAHQRRLGFGIQLGVWCSHDCSFRAAGLVSTPSDLRFIFVRSQQ